MATREKSKELLENPAKWPLGDVLPMKNPNRPRMLFGVVLPHDPLVVQFIQDMGDLQAEVFTNVDEMLNAGWRVD